jgi:hypothetical protein
MTKICGILAVAGIAASANATPSATIDLLVSSDGGSTWSNAVDVLPGTVVRCAIFVSVTDAYGFGGATITALTGSGASASDSAAFAPGTATGRVSPFSFGAATNAIFAIAGGFRIDAASDAGNANTAAGMTFSQRDPATAEPGTYMDGSQARMAFAFDVTVGGDAAIRSIEMAFGPLVRGVATVHTAANSSRGTTTSAVTLDGARINVIPTPASLALVGLGGLVAGRRRR